MDKVNRYCFDHWASGYFSWEDKPNVEEVQVARDAWNAALHAAGVTFPCTVTDDEVFAALQRHRLRLDSAQARADMRRALEGFLEDRARATGVQACRFFNGKCMDCERALTGDVTDATLCGMDVPGEGKNG